MTGRTISDHRRRYGYLLGIDRYRIVAIWSDGSRVTESFDELTITRAQETAAALASPTGGEPTAVEVWAGAWQAVGQLDCEWRDHHRQPVTAAARSASGALTWSDRPAADLTATDPRAGQQLALI